jgi:hypothetical protein
LNIGLPQNLILKKNKAIQQEIEVAKKLGSKLIITADTQKTIWVNALAGEKIKDENGQIVTANFAPHDEKLSALLEKNQLFIKQNISKELNINSVIVELE